jgi:hypothetical protein
MPGQRNLFALVPLGMAVLLGACKGATEVCNDPLTCTGVTGITVTSPTVDTVMATGRTAQLVAAAVSGGSSVTVPFSWTAAPTSVATVAPATGLVTGVAAGTVMITVGQSNNAVTGQLRMHVVDADLPLVTDVVTDTLSARLRQALSNTPRGVVTTNLTTCSGHVGTGNLLALDACLNTLTGVSGGSNGNDNALLNVLDVFFTFARQQLQL